MHCTTLQDAPRLYQFAYHCSMYAIKLLIVLTDGRLAHLVSTANSLNASNRFDVVEQSDVRG